MGIFRSSKASNAPVQDMTGATPDSTNRASKVSNRAAAKNNKERQAHADEDLVAAQREMELLVAEHGTSTSLLASKKQQQDVLNRDVKQLQNGVASRKEQVDRQKKEAQKLQARLSESQAEWSAVEEEAARHVAASEAARARLRKLEMLRKSLQRAKEDAATTRERSATSAIAAAAREQEECAQEIFRTGLNSSISEISEAEKERGGWESERAKVQTQLESIIREQAEIVQRRKDTEVVVKATAAENNELRAQVRVAQERLQEVRREYTRRDGEHVLMGDAIESQQEKIVKMGYAYHDEVGVVSPIIADTKMRKQVAVDAHAKRILEIEAAGKIRHARADASLAGSRPASRMDFQAPTGPGRSGPTIPVEQHVREILTATAGLTLAGKMMVGELLTPRAK